MGILRPLLPHFRGGSRYAGRASYSCISSMSSRTVEPWGSLPILSTLHNKKSALRRISFVMERVMGILRLLLPHFRGGRSSRTRVLLLYFPRCLHGRSNPWGSLPILSTLHNKKSALRRISFVMERVMGIEPTPAAWEAAVLPLNYTRI